MLQTALNTTTRALAQFEYCVDEEDKRDILAECESRLGMSDEELGIVRIRRTDMREIRAVGTTGKRSIMLAVVLAAVLFNDAAIEELAEALTEYGLNEVFIALLVQTRNSTRSVAPVVDEEHPGEREVHGATLNVIFKSVPVIEIAPKSVFHENASWLLQTALDAWGKADACFAHDEDPKILAECQARFGLQKQETGIVRLRRKDVQHLKAVGTAGKRSMMIAAMVAYCMHEEDGLRNLRDAVESFSSDLWNYTLELCNAAREMAGRPRYGESSSSSSSGGDRREANCNWAHGDSWAEDWWRERTQDKEGKRHKKPLDLKPSTPGKKDPGNKEDKKDDSGDLDRQLASYMGEDAPPPEVDSKASSSRPI